VPCGSAAGRVRTHALFASVPVGAQLVVSGSTVSMVDDAGASSTLMCSANVVVSDGTHALGLLTTIARLSSSASVTVDASLTSMGTLSVLNEPRPPTGTVVVVEPSAKVTPGVAVETVTVVSVAST